MRIATYVLLALLLLLQYSLWFGSGGALALWQIQRQIAAQRVENAKLQTRNAVLEAEVADLKHGLGAIEERARMDLGMIKRNETFFQVVDASPRSP